MSKRIQAQIECPSCGEKFNTELYRSIWIEEPKNRKLIFQDEINAVTCPSCKKKTRLEFPFLCTNVKKEIAIWYEPYHDQGIDEDIAKYKSHMGGNSFYAKAPRIKNWEEFKEKIIEYENLKEESHEENEMDFDMMLDERDMVVLDLQEKGEGYSEAQIKDEIKRGQAVWQKLDNSWAKGLMLWISMSTAERETLMKQQEQKEKNNKSQYPKFLKPLSTNKGRLLLSPLAFVIFLLFGSLIYWQLPEKRDYAELLVAWSIFTVISYGILTLLHIIVTNWAARRNLRVWCFGSLYWFIGVILFVVIFEPYGGRGMRDDDYIHMFMVMLFPPLFLGSAKYVYDKYVK